MLQPLRQSVLGDLTAEGDNAALQSSFLETPDYRSLLESDDATIVVGRRGTGKSALFLRLAKEWGSGKASHVITIAPDDFQVIGLRAVLAPFESKFNYVKAAARILWRYTLLVEMLAHLSKNYKSRELLSTQARALDHVRRWSNDGKSILQKLSNKAMSVIGRPESLERAIADLPIQLELQELETTFEKVLETSNLTIHILIDRLDEGYEPDHLGTGIISGVAGAITDLNKKYERVRAVIFLRDNIARALAKLDPDYSRNIEGETLRLHWDSYQLLNLVALRLKRAFAIEAEQSQRIWDRCTANELKTLDGFKKCLQFTLYRPRDLLLLLNKAYYEAGRKDRSIIIPEDVESSAKTISQNRLDDLCKEYNKIFPSIEVATRVFANQSPELTYVAALEQVDKVFSNVELDSSPAIASDATILQPEGMVRALYSVGFIGVHDPASNSFTFCHDGNNPNKEFVHTDKVLVHPCYWIALNLTKNALEPEEAEEINDEYEIHVSSLTPAIRAHRIGELIGELHKIPLGHDGSSEFEEWCASSLQTIFASHLSNIEPKPNKAAVQRRDIVGTNLSKSSAWARINQDYETRQVVFEVKNFKDIGSDEFRQLGSYLNGQYGSLGFVITRDDDESLRAGPELDWVREMALTQGKLVVKLTGSTLCRLLSKLRSPEKHDAIDKALNNILDTYERVYLSLKSTRLAKKGKQSRPSSRSS